MQEEKDIRQKLVKSPRARGDHGQFTCLYHARIVMRFEKR